jgi:hypothetical protein
MSLSHADLKRLLHYDPETGHWFRLTSFRANYQAGDRADVPYVNGYRRVRIKKISYYAARLAIFYMTGAWPDEVTDHRNRIRDDDRWRNIRPATQSQNRANSAKGKRRKMSKYKGVYKRKNRWVAHVHYRGKMYWAGSHLTEFAAHKAYDAKAKEVFGEFARAR